MNSIKNILKSRAAVAHKLELDLNTIKSLKRMHAGNRGNAGLMATLVEIKALESRVAVHRATIKAFNFCLQDEATDTKPDTKTIDTFKLQPGETKTVRFLNHPIQVKAGKVPSTHRDHFIAHRDGGKNVSIQGTIRNLVTKGYGPGKPYTATDILSDLRRMEVIAVGAEGLNGANAAYTAIRKLAKIGTIKRDADKGTLVTIQPAN